MPSLPMPSAGMQGGPSAWIQSPNYLPANYIQTPQGPMPAVYPPPSTQPGSFPPAPAPAVYPPALLGKPITSQAQPMQGAENLTPAMLLKMLEESDYPSQREWAADQLAVQSARSSPQVVDALMTAARKDPAATVRSCCVRCLARIGVQTTPMTSLLKDLQKDPDPRVRDAVGESMQALGVSSGKAAEILPVNGRE
jgi:hypothetical protein